MYNKKNRFSINNITIILIKKNRFSINNITIILISIASYQYPQYVCRF